MNRIRTFTKSLVIRWYHNSWFEFSLLLIVFFFSYLLQDILTSIIPSLNFNLVPLIGLLALIIFFSIEYFIVKTERVRFKTFARYNAHIVFRFVSIIIACAVVLDLENIYSDSSGLFYFVPLSDTFIQFLGVHLLLYAFFSIAIVSITNFVLNYFRNSFHSKMLDYKEENGKVVFCSKYYDDVGSIISATVSVLFAFIVVIYLEQIYRYSIIVELEYCINVNYVNCLFYNESIYELSLRAFESGLSLYKSILPVFFFQPALLFYRKFKNSTDELRNNIE